TFGKIYTRLVEELYRYHDITVADNIAGIHGTELVVGVPPQPQPVSENPLPVPAQEASHNSTGGKQAFVNSTSQEVFRGMPSSILKLVDSPPQEAGINR